MARKRATAKTSTINRATPAMGSDLERYCRGLGRLAAFVHGVGKRCAAWGEELVACFRPFLERLIGSDMSLDTIQKDVDNLWLLGGEIIRNLNEDRSVRKLRGPPQTAHFVKQATGGGGEMVIETGCVTLAADLRR